MPKKLTTDEFIKRCNEKHQFRWDYSLLHYIGSGEKVTILCQEHGEFNQRASDHLSGCGCPKCDSTSKMTTEIFIEKSLLKHGLKFDYSGVEYGRHNYDPVTIICPEHGAFNQRPWAHLRGQGCPKCSNNKLMTGEEFILKSTEIHGNKWDYSKVNYLGRRKPVTIICPKHGDFQQEARVHLDGWGCKKCSSSKMEDYLSKELDVIGETYERDKRFVNCKRKLPLPFDFYLPNRKILIECDGIQHLQPVEHFGGVQRFSYQKENDYIKDKWSSDFGYILIRLKNTEEIDLFLKTLNTN